MRLYLVRHGIAIDRGDPECPPEPDRYLTQEGVTRTRKAMRGLRRLGIEPDAILTSPYVRAAQTAAIAAEELRFPPKKIRTTKALLPEAAPAKLLSVIARSETQEIVCCGHAPNLDTVIAHLVGAVHPFTSLKKAGAACIELESMRAGSGILRWLYPADLLRSIEP